MHVEHVARALGHFREGGCCLIPHAFYLAAFRGTIDDDVLHRCCLNMGLRGWDGGLERARSR